MAAGYFRNFPIEVFEFDGLKYSLEDLTRKVVYSPEAFDNGVQIEELALTGERPDVTAHLLYSDSNLWWTFFVVNNKTINDWPMSDDELEDYMASQWTPWQLAQPYEYLDSDGKSIPPAGWKRFTADGKEIYYGFNPNEFLNPAPVQRITKSNGELITLREHLIRENDAKKTIYVIRKTFIKDFIDDFVKKLLGNVELN